MSNKSQLVNQSSDSDIELFDFNQSPTTISSINVTVINANELNIEVKALDFVNLKQDNYQIVVWEGAITPPYEDIENNIVKREGIYSSTSKATFTVTAESMDVNFYNGVYCVGFLMGDRLQSVCSYSSLVGGAEVTVFQSVIYALTVSASQISIGFVTPNGNNPELNRQYIDVYSLDEPVRQENALNIIGHLSSYSAGQIVIKIKEGIKLERGKSYRALYDFNKDFSSYGSEAIFTIPK
ncbi:MAG: hypothetical protein JKY68_07200 [Rhodospirillales bacterium]|nr:hypothetical protein [Rhodospirillales bacterium]